MAGFKRMAALAACMTLTCSAFAWGGFEHSIVAYIAQDYLTENAERNIRYYLDQPLAEYAEWMDHVPTQKTPKYRDLIKQNHSFTLHEDGSIPTESIFGNGECGGTHTMNMIIDTLMDHKNQPDSLVILYLRCMIHMFGDMHCPGHIISHHAPGGIAPDGSWRNNYQFKKCNYEGQSKAMHWMWDTALQNEKPGWTFEDWRVFLDTYTPEQRAQVSQGTFNDWLKECAEDVKQVYQWWQPGQNYDRSWYDGKVAEYAHDHIRHAGYRLAKLLNDIFDHE